MKSAVSPEDSPGTVQSVEKAAGVGRSGVQKAAGAGSPVSPEDGWGGQYSQSRTMRGGPCFQYRRIERSAVQSVQKTARVSKPVSPKEFRGGPCCQYRLVKGVDSQISVEK